MRCVHCFATCDRLFCSVSCAEERYSLMLEGVKLLDEVMAMVDTAAAARGAAPTTSTPRASTSVSRAQRKPGSPETIPEPETDPPPLLFVPPSGDGPPLPGGIDPQGRNP